MADSRDRRVQQRWGDAVSTAALRDVFWTSSAVVASHVNRRTTGLANADWLTWLDNLVLRPRGDRLDCLVLGCGEGWLERALAPSPAIRHIMAMDVSPRAIAEAERLAHDLGLGDTISYRVAHLDRDPLPRAAFDVTIAHSVLHHVERLEFAYGQIANALRPGGLLVVNEYVGPCRLQFSDDQIDRINAIMARLPARFRRSALTGEVLERRQRPQLDVVVATDPSEAIRSEEVLAIAERHFDIVHRLDYGGSLLQPLLYELVPNFDDDDPEHSAILGLLCLLEESLIDAGVLPSDYVFALAKRRVDDRLGFVLPPLGAAPTPRPAPPSPWLPVSRLPETADLRPIQQHLALRVTGDSLHDPLKWCLDQAETACRRPLDRCRCLLLEPAGFSDLLATRFRELDVAWPPGPKERYNVLLSIGTLTVADLLDTELVERIRHHLTRHGAAVIVAPVRTGDQAPSRSIERIVRSAAASLPDNLRPAALSGPVPPGCSRAPAPDLERIPTVLAESLHVLLFKPLGWPLLQVLVPLLAGLVDATLEADVTMLDLLCLLDQQLVDDGVLPTEFLLVIARRR